jgi:hypothetical protein
MYIHIYIILNRVFASSIIGRVFDIEIRRGSVES